MEKYKYLSAGFIPFKKESERVPGKNFRKLGKKPLFKHIIEKALKSNLDVVFISTNSESAKKEIINLKNPKLKIIDCPDEYFQGSTTGDKLLTHHLNIDAKIFVQLFVTAPFLKIETINKAIEVLDKGNNYDSAFTVKEEYVWAWYNGNPITYFP